jgi:mannose-6-phosphate isomerase-like protein (cupin superfamily)
MEGGALPGVPQDRQADLRDLDLLPGQGDRDKGHAKSHEIFFVSRGRVMLHVPDRNEYFELHEQDIILMPEGVPHTLINIGEEKAVISWSMAPSQ